MFAPDTRCSLGDFRRENRKMAPAKYELRPLTTRAFRVKGMAANVHLTSPVDSEKDADLILDYGQMGLSGPMKQVFNRKLELMGNPFTASLLQAKRDPMLQHAIQNAESKDIEGAD